MPNLFTSLSALTVLGAILWGFTGQFWFLGVPALALLGWVGVLGVLLARAQRDLEGAASSEGITNFQKNPIRVK